MARTPQRRIVLGVLGVLGVLLLLILAGVVQPLAAVGLAPRPAHAAAAPTRITIDAGHGGGEIGAAYRFADGTVLDEKSLNLEVALLLRDRLEQAGYRVTLTRASDTALNVARKDLNGDGRVGLADELQARVDLANAAGSDLFLSICFNGSSDPSAKGTETFWNPKRPFAAANRRFAEHVQQAIVRRLASAGYATRDRGAQTDASLLAGESFYVLGPRSSIVARPSEMPGVIAEPLFLTNPADAAALRDPRIVSAIAQALFDAIQASSGRAATPDVTAVTPDVAAVTPDVTAVTPGATRARPRVTAVTPDVTAVTAGVTAVTPGVTARSSSGRWTVWAETYAASATGRGLAQRAARALQARGQPADVLVTSGVASLLPGYLVVTSGEFATREAALAHAARLRQAGAPRAYVRPVPR